MIKHYNSNNNNNNSNNSNNNNNNNSNNNNNNNNNKLVITTIPRRMLIIDILPFYCHRHMLTALRNQKMIFNTQMVINSIVKLRTYTIYAH